jgi:hypothetical protein
MDHFVPSSSDRDKDNERACFQGYLLEYIMERLPPGCRLTPEMEEAVKAFMPSECPQDRKRFIEATTLAADRLLIGVWRTALRDARQDKAVLKFCMQRSCLRFPLNFPLIRSMLAKMRPDRRRVFLLREVLGFNVECTSEITDFSRRKVERLHGAVRSMIGSCLSTKKGDDR